MNSATSATAAADSNSPKKKSSAVQPKKRHSFVSNELDNQPSNRDK